TRQLDDCRLAQRELVRIRQLLTYRDGIVIVTGPTGSGKTTTLYSAIKEIATGDINIMTVEDPIEYELPGITQMQVEAKRGVTFASALRAILRQDPDVIFVGEIRDEETAQVAAQAAMTGHLVLATLHTNDAMSAVTRLADLGLDRATVAATLRGSVAQRLVRRACPDCAVPLGPADELTEREQRLAAAYGMRPVVRAAGCARCSMTGFLGRIPVNEVAVVTPHLAEQIAAGATMQALQRAAVSAGMRTLREVALERAAKGETTLQEVERVLGDTSVEAPPPEAAQPARPRVLVVDDDPVTRTLAATLLDGAGFSVVQADDGDVALERLQAGEEFSLVVTDLHMARMNGDQLLAALRGNVQTAGLPVIVLTGSAEYETEVALMDAGADDYIRKPIDPPRFMARVKAALRRAGA
ncbi:MAG TPA: ATPase, T2SS/T4P/T4SS family, partial [Gemmatimonadaceae bacterium]|nr:ATPase, T2SS/T4P/T4SS family [Gemmatimonadaceae bacterium]